jgi:hypothetical protein
MRLQEVIEQVEVDELIKQDGTDYSIKLEDGKFINTIDGSVIVFYKKWFYTDDWQIIKKKTVTAESYYYKKHGCLSSGRFMHHISDHVVEAFKAGESNTHLLYAELMEALEELLNRGLNLDWQKVEKQIKKIKEINAKI